MGLSMEFQFGRVEVEHVDAKAKKFCKGARSSCMMAGVRVMQHEQNREGLGSPVREQRDRRDVDVSDAAEIKQKREHDGCQPAADHYHF